jgi:hypothetical protein
LCLRIWYEIVWTGNVGVLMALGVVMSVDCFMPGF